MTLRASYVTFDCANPRSLAQFWSDALGYPIEEHQDADALLLDPSQDGRGLFFQRVPEAKVVKNRVHLDLVADGSRVPEVERLTGLGASVFETFDRWTVMLDPEGNEFCVADGAADDGPAEGADVGSHSPLGPTA